MIATTSAGKTSLATTAGVHHVVDYAAADAAEQIHGFAPDGVDLVVEVAIGTNQDLDLAVLRPRGTIAIYANNGDKPYEVDVRQNMGLNSRIQFVLLYSVGWEILTAAAEDINAAIADDALPVGEAAGLPLHHFPLAKTVEAHQAVESGATGKVLITVADL